MNRSVVEMLATAAREVVVGHAKASPLFYATWSETTRDPDFEPKSTIRLLRSEGCDVDDSLIHRYAELHQEHSTISLIGIDEFAPWLIGLDRTFVDYDSFRSLRAEFRFVEVLTFTTPAVSDDGRCAFLEIWTEDGRHSHRGCWYWLQLRRADFGWKLDWKNLHALS